MTVEHLSIQYEALTPLYTGNWEGKVDRLYESGILGSLRWWLEALIRGAGGLALDPTAGKSNFDVEAYERHFGELTDDAFRHTDRLRRCGLDDADQVFGATGWRRRFRLDVASAAGFPRVEWSKIAVADRSRSVEERGRVRDKVPEWPLKDRPFKGAFNVRLLALDPGFPVSIIGGLLSFLEEWAGIGAKNQVGMGVIRQTGGDTLERGPLLAWLRALPPADAGQRRDMAGLPSLDNLFLARVRVPDDKKETAFRFKIDLRRRFTDDRVRHFVMGTIRDKRLNREGRLAAKVKISLPYWSEAEQSNVMRVWGWLPHASTFYTQAMTRAGILGIVRGEMGKLGPELLWRDFAAGVEANETETGDFLRDLQALTARNKDERA